MMPGRPPRIPQMLLVIDVGNTNIVLGVFDGEDLVTDIRLHTDERSTGDELGLTVVDLLRRRGIETDGIDAVAISNVVPSLQRAVEELTATYFGVVPLSFGPGTRTGIRILYDDPRQVGADRIANAIAAFHLHGGPAILVDFGTGTTIDAINEKGDYLGGAIAPGITVALDALVGRAARLTRVDLVAPPSPIGRNTTTSIQAGTLFGYVGLVEGLVGRIRAELGGTAAVIATGGLAPLFQGLTDVIDHVEPHLTLIGLRLVYELNRDRDQP